MNKTHGLVATAWMLGGGMLLDATMTAEAQVYYTPGASSQSAAVPSQRVPGMLPDSLRSGNQTPSGAVVRPIAPNANHKMGGTTLATTPSASKSRPAIQPATHQLTGAPSYQNNNSGNVQSPVQKQLEELYRKDGRPMPQMNFSQTPSGAVNGAPVATAAQRPSQPVAQSNVVPSRNKPGLLSRLNPFRSKPAPAPVAVQPQAPRPVQNVAGQVPQTQPRPVIQPRPMTPPNAAPRPLAPGAQPFVISPVPTAAAAIEVVETTKSVSASGLADTLPPVPGEGVTNDSITSAKSAATNGAASIDDALNDAFKDLDETTESKVAEVTEAAKPIVEAVPMADENPFSGLSLDEPAGPIPTPPIASDEKVAVQPTAKASDDAPLELPPLESAKAADGDALLLPPEPAPVDASVATETEEQIESKMKLIAERGELRGLKGFCAVALRDERDLKNAMPEHTSTFKGRTYYFSTAEAKVAFDENPDHYAPVAGGNDVVLLKTKVTKEGSLDFAVWYKDRLHLFTSQKTLEQFVATPKEFATHE